MKKMILILLCGTLSAGYAQEFKVSKSSGRLEIREVNHVSIEGTTGNEIVFTARDRSRDRDQRAEGLRAISSLGLEDNTGLGLSVVDKGNVVEVQQLRKTEGPDITILVPKGVVVSYTHSSPYGEEIAIKNFDGEIEISTTHNGVTLSNVSGPVSVKTVHGDIDVSLSATPKGPIDLQSIHGHVDVALAQAAKANVSLSTQRGEILVDPDFKIELDRTGSMVNYSDQIHGKLNGGGIDVALTAQHNNIYLRTK